MPAPRELMNRLILLASRDAARLRDYTARRALVPAARRLSVVLRIAVLARVHARDRPATDTYIRWLAGETDREFRDRARTGLSRRR
jgi:hypothetical protein